MIHQFRTLLLLLFCLLVKLADAQFLFHGTSIVIYPNSTSTWPSDSTMIASNFYCYASLKGYLSFGWWLPASLGADTSHCTPRPSSYDWYEYTTSWKCTKQDCRAHAINFSTSNETEPYFEEEYILSSADAGNGVLGKFGVSYFNKEGGGYAVGTKQILSDVAEGFQSIRDCEEAFKTLQDIKEEKDLALPFEMINICPSVGGHSRQKAMGPGMR